MTARCTTKILEALHVADEDAGAADEFICEVFDFAAMLAHYQMGDAAKRRVTGSVRIIRDVLDGVKMRMIREDKLN
jgi:hypothetical protein